MNGYQGLQPPPNSWGSNAESELAVVFLEMKPGGSFSFPAAVGGNAVNRMAYFIEGDCIELNGKRVTSHAALTLQAAVEVEFSNPHPTQSSQILILQGERMFICLVDYHQQYSCKIEKCSVEYRNV